MSSRVSSCAGTPARPRTLDAQRGRAGRQLAAQGDRRERTGRVGDALRTAVTRVDLPQRQSTARPGEPGGVAVGHQVDDGLDESRLVGRRHRPRGARAGGAARGESPLHSDSPVHADGGVTTSALPLVVAVSASTTCTPSWATRVVADCAAAATSGRASSASIESRPWMVDSAPEFWLTTPSALRPSNGAAGRRVVHRGTGPVRAEVPGRGDPGERVEARPVGRVGDRDQGLHAGVDAVGDLGQVERGRAATR